MNPHTKTNNQSGNALLYILICVGLFASLSYVVANMTRSGTNDLSKEKITLAVSEILNFSGSARSGIQKMRASGVLEQDISFENENLPGYENPNCVTEACKFFSPMGGGVAYAAPDLDWLDGTHSASPEFGKWYFPDKTCVFGAGDEGVACAGDGVDNEDLVAILPWLNLNVCLAINDKLGVPNPAGAPPADADGIWPAAVSKFTGTYDETGGAQIGSSIYRSACVAANGGYVFYVLLLAR